MEELSVVYREYYGISWGKALDAARVPVDSDLRWPEIVYYDPEIRKLPGPDSSNPEQAPDASERPLVDQAPPAPFEAKKMMAKVRKPRISKALVRIKARRKLILILRRKP